MGRHTRTSCYSLCFFFRFCIFLGIFNVVLSLKNERNKNICRSKKKLSLLLLLVFINTHKHTHLTLLLMHLHFVCAFICVHVYILRVYIKEQNCCIFFGISQLLYLVAVVLQLSLFPCQCWFLFLLF